MLGSAIGSLFGIAIALNLTPLMKVIEHLIGHQFLSGDIYFVDFLPSQLHWPDVALVSITAIVLSLLATWYPCFCPSLVDNKLNNKLNNKYIYKP